MELSVLARIGGDRALDVAEIGSKPDAMVRRAWQTYVEQFGGFTGATLDPQFARLDHPARSLAAIEVSKGTSVVIVGTGPSLVAQAASLKRVRSRVSIWTSIRGVEVLASFGISADLLLVQHGSDLDAHLTTRHLRDRNHVTPLVDAPIVLAEPRTPAALLAGVPQHRLAAVDGSIGWGLWPATLAALALEGGAAAVGLAGIDLGTPESVEPVHRPLIAVLELLASSASGVRTIDLGKGALKPRWMRGEAADIGGAPSHDAVRVRHVPWPDRDTRYAMLGRALDALSEPLLFVEDCRSRATAARGVRSSTAETCALLDMWRTLLSWRADPGMRRLVQDDLGARFLPRFWRQDPSALDGPAWRPILLATHELLLQAESARARVDSRRTGTWG